MIIDITQTLKRLLGAKFCQFIPFRFWKGIFLEENPLLNCHTVPLPLDRPQSRVTHYPFLSKKTSHALALPLIKGFDKRRVVLYKGLGARISPRGRPPQMLVR